MSKSCQWQITPIKIVTQWIIITSQLKYLTNNNTHTAVYFVYITLKLCWHNRWKKNIQTNIILTITQL